MSKRNRNKGRSCLAPDHNDSWAQVELYRWQHGELPCGNEKPLDISKAIIAMADAIERGCKEKDTSIMPTPYNICSVLRYLSNKVSI